MAAKIKTSPATKSKHRFHRPKRISKQDIIKVYWPYLPVMLIAGALLITSFNSGMLASSLHRPAGQTLDYALSMNMQKLLDETNAARASNGSKNLTLNPKLFAAAQSKAEDMANKNYWSHYTPDGSPPWVFVTAEGYDYKKLGENLATGFLDEKSTVNGWMASKGHRENLLDPMFSEVGFGVANSSDYTSGGGGPMTIIVAMYGLPRVQTASTLSVPSSTSARPVAVANTDSLTPSDDKALSYNLSRGEVALAQLPFGSIAGILLLVVMFAAAAFWVTKHALQLKKAVVRGEKFIFKHKLLDVGLLMIIVLAYLLMQSAGVVG